MRRLRNAIDLAWDSWQVLKLDGELLMLPIMSGIASLIALASFIVPVYLTWGEEVFTEAESVIEANIVLAFVVYFVLAFITIFFNAALVHAACERFKGGDPTVGSALRGAGARLVSILGWSLVAATVSLVLQLIEERFELVGRIVARLMGLAWGLVTFLVIPVLVIEETGATRALKRSGQLFKETWGENVSAQVGFGLLGFVLVIPAFILIGLTIPAGQVSLTVMAAIAGLAWILVVSVVLSALNAVFRTALYLYAVEGELPSDHFDRYGMKGAFTPKRRRS
jgi:hypothetical protein